MDTFDRDYRDDPRYKGHRDNISAFVEPRPVDPKKVCDVFNQTQLLHGPTARQYKLESPPLSVVDLLLLSISRWLKLLAAKMLQKTPNALSRPPVVDLLLLQCCCCSCAIARAPVDIRLRGERGQRGQRAKVVVFVSGQKLVVFVSGQRVRSGVLHAMRPRAVPDSKGVQS